MPRRVCTKLESDKLAVQQTHIKPVGVKPLKRDTQNKQVWIHPRELRETNVTRLEIVLPFFWC